MLSCWHFVTSLLHEFRRLSFEKRMLYFSVRHFSLWQSENMWSSWSLYSDNGLACFENTSGLETERIRKAFIKLFKNEFSLNIVRETNLKVVSFLDLTLNLSTGKYKPYNKPDNKPLYNNVNSNHPPNIKKNLPESISWRINKLSYDKTVFNNSKKLFNNALSNSGFDHKMKFQPLTEDKDRGHNNSRGRKIVRFNPLYSCNVAINTGKKSLLLLDKYFSKARKLSKVLNCNNVKVSYNSMPNVASMTNAHTRRY